MQSLRPPTIVFALILLTLGGPTLAARPDGQLELTVVDTEAKQPLAARIELVNPRGRAVNQRGLGIAPLGDHFYIDGGITLGLRRGAYKFTLDAGPEYRTQQGHFEIERHADDAKEVAMERAVRLDQEGWFASDLDAPRSGQGLAIAARAEQLTYVPLVTWQRDKNRWDSNDKKRIGEDAPTSAIGPYAAKDDSKAAGLTFYRTDEPLTRQTVEAIEGTSCDELRKLRDDGWHIVANDLTDWRLPIWLAHDVIDAAMVIDRATLTGKEAKPMRGKSGDAARFASGLGVGRWREAIYFHALSAGLKLPAVAGSGSGDNERPLGSGRVYALLPDGFNPTAWWDAVTAGETFITTGPLLRPHVNGRAPGHTFQIEAGGKLELQVALSLTTRDPIEYIEIIQNGEAVVTVPLREVASSGGKLPPLEFDTPGWFVLRAVTNNGRRYDRAMTGAYYVEQSGQPFISRKSCQFFLDWLGEYEAKLTGKASDDLITAKEFWKNRLRAANAE